jgi:hypothetical protein
MKSQLGFYMWAYANVESVDYAFEKLRISYPDSEIVLSSDNGEDFSYMIDKFKLLFYQHGDSSHGPSHSSIEGGGRYGWTANEAKLWLERVYIACKCMTHNFVMLMEEDILVKERFKFPNNDIVMIPGFKNPIGKAGLEWIKSRGGCINYPYYSAGGGTIIKRETFVNAYEKHIDSLIENYESIYDSCMKEGAVGWGWNDSLVCVLMYAENANFSTELPILETGNEEDNAPIIHKFKKFYRKKYVAEEAEDIHIFYHAYLDGSYKLIIQEQLEKVFLSGLYKACKTFNICVATPDKSRYSWIEKITKKFDKIRLERIEIDRTKYPDSYRESKITLQRLKNMAEETPGYYCYFHTKGSTNKGYNIEMWRKSCDWATICDWEKSIQMLKNGYDAVGPNLRPDSHIGKHPHFSGTYWWTTHKHINTLDYSYLTDVREKLLEEFWIGSNHSAKLGSTYECGHIAPYLVESEIDSYIQ